MKLWIVGHNGQLGTACRMYCQTQGIPFISSSKEEVNPSDYDQLMQWAEDKEMTHILNCAAYTHVDQAETHHEEAIAANVMIPKHLAQLANQREIKLIHFSSDFVFDGKQSLPYQETDVANPINIYGMTKKEGEQMVLSLSSDNLVIRTSWLYGLNGKNFFLTIFGLLQEKEKLSIVSDQYGSPTYVYDLVEATFALLDQKGIFHFCNGGVTSWYGFAKEIYLRIKEEYPIQCHTLEAILTKDYPTPAKRPHYSAMSTSKYTKTTSHVPRDWKAALSHCVQQLKGHYVTK